MKSGTVFGVIGLSLAMNCGIAFAADPLPPLQDMMILPPQPAPTSGPSSPSAPQAPGKSISMEETDLKFQGQFRMRYLNLTRPTGDTDTFEASQGFIEQRSLLGLSLRRGEPVRGYISLVHATRWGRANDTTNNGTASEAAVGNSAVGVNDGTGNSNNMALVNEAWGWWKATDSISIKLGRQAFFLGDESVFSRNEFEQFPTALDGGVVSWDFDRMVVSAFGFKLEEYARPSIGGSDPESNLYGASVDGKELPEIVSMAHAHILQKAAQQSGIDGSRGVEELGQNIQRFGMALKLETSIWDWRLSGALVNGQMQDRSTLTSVNTSVNAYMYDTEAGIKWGEYFRTRLFVGYHYDTGDGDYQDRKTEEPASGPDRRWGRYQSLFFNRHKFSGLMDVVDWGNINYWTVGGTITPLDNMNVTLQFLVFQRSSAGDRITPGTRGRYMLGNGDTYTPGSPHSLAVGHELETHVEYQLDNGFTFHGIAGVFTPGRYLQNGLTPTQGPIKQTYVQALAMASYQF